MHLTLGFAASLVIAIASARPPSGPTRLYPRQTVPPAAVAPGATPKPSYSVGVVTFQYIQGNKTFQDVETYTDYGTAIPSDIVNEIGTADLPTATDPCGPTVQDPYTPPTCNSPNDTSSTNSSDISSIDGFGYDASYVYEVLDTPEAYGVLCENSTTSTAVINTQNCELTTVDICNKIRSKYSPHDKWVWSTLGGPGCAMGYWLPGANGSAPAPLKDRCEQGIFQAMSDICVTVPSYYPSNMATVNLIQGPGTNGTGQQVNAGYPSYIIAPEQMPGPAMS